MKTRILKIFSLPALVFLLLMGCKKDSYYDPALLTGRWESVDALIDGASDPDWMFTVYIFNTDGTATYQVYGAGERPVIDVTAPYTCTDNKLRIINDAMRMEATVVTLTHENLRLRTKDVYGRSREDILKRANEEDD